LKDNTGLNAICLNCSQGDTVCSNQAPWGEWFVSAKKCANGYTKVSLRVQKYQGKDKDDTGTNDIKFWCDDKNNASTKGEGGV